MCINHLADEKQCVINYRLQGYTQCVADTEKGAMGSSEGLCPPRNKPSGRTGGQPKNQQPPVKETAVLKTSAHSGSYVTGLETEASALGCSWAGTGFRPASNGDK